MSGDGIKILSENSAIDQIIETVKKSEPCEAPFALVIGAGFSHRLVPTVREIVQKHLPKLDNFYIPNALKPLPNSKMVWQGEAERRHKEQHEEEEIRRRAAFFWKKFAEENESCGLKLDLSNQGLPLNNWFAYQCAFDPSYTGALGDSLLAGKFLRGLMNLNVPRLNAAHFLLASILGAQPSTVPPKRFGKIKNHCLFKFQSAFSRLILTTNFDPFLQIALQYANRLYFMSDTLNLVEKDLSENQTDAIHLVYVHGSIHRHAQAHTDEEIRNIKEANAKVLAPILKTRAIIVIGYSGWDDVVVEALAACDKFEYGLYWLGLRAKPLAKGAFGLRVPEILEKPGAYYVPIKGAGHFMNQLNNRLVYGLPLLDNPIAQLRRKLALINLQELDDLEIGLAEISLNGVTQIAHNIVDKPTFKLAKQIASQGLEIAEGVFFKQCEEGSIRHLKSQARLANLCTGRIKICDKALTIPNLSVAHQISFLELRSHAFFMSGKVDEAIADLTRIIETPNAPDKSVWQALLNRAAAFWQIEERKNLAAAEKDLSLAIEEIPTSQTSPDLKKLRIQCLYHRGGVLCDRERYEESISDFTSVIEAGDLEDSINGLFSRAFVWEIMGDNDKAIDDYSLILKSPYRAPCGQQSKALSKRGWVYYIKKDFPSFLRDTEMALQNSSPPNYAAYNLGLALLANGRDAEALVAYRHAAKQYPKSIDDMGLADLRDAMNKWLNSERAKPCNEFLESFKKDSTFTPAA